MTFIKKHYAKKVLRDLTTLLDLFISNEEKYDYSELKKELELGRFPIQLFFASFSDSYTKSLRLYSNIEEDRWQGKKIFCDTEYEYKSIKQIIENMATIYYKMDKESAILNQRLINDIYTKNIYSQLTISEIKEFEIYIKELNIKYYNQFNLL